MKKTLILMIALFVLTMFATVSAHDNQNKWEGQKWRITIGDDSPHDPPPPEPPHDPPPPDPHDPPPPDPHDPHGPY